jgi:hypothetical protein
MVSLRRVEEMKWMGGEWDGVRCHAWITERHDLHNFHGKVWVCDFVSGCSRKTLASMRGRKEFERKCRDLRTLIGLKLQGTNKAKHCKKRSTESKKI